MNQNILSRFELIFLDFTIQALSRSYLTRSLLMRTYSLMHQSKLISLCLLLAISGMVGLMSGCLFYVLVNGS